MDDPNLVELDKLDIDISEYNYDPNLLEASGVEDISEFFPLIFFVLSVL